MANSVSASINLGIKVEYSKDGEVGAISNNISINEAVRFIGGTADTDEANVLFADTRTLAASATENLDLAGVLTDPFGATITAAEVTAIYIKAHPANTNSVILGAATNPFLGPLGATGTITFKPGEWTVLASPTGWAVTASTGDLLKVANSAGTTGVTYTIVIMGRTIAA